MPSEYEALVAALKLTDIPFAEYGWDRKPDGAYGVVTLDMESPLKRCWKRSAEAHGI